jgi:hypothetical protein
MNRSSRAALTVTTAGVQIDAISALIVPGLVSFPPASFANGGHHAVSVQDGLVQPAPA